MKKRNQRPELIIREKNGAPSVELRMAEQDRCFWKTLGYTIVLGAALYFSHGGIANKGYCGWQKGTPLREDIAHACQQVDDVVIKPSAEVLGAIINRVDGSYKKLFGAWGDIEEMHHQKPELKGSGDNIQTIDDQVQADGKKNSADEPDEVVLSPESDLESKFINDLYQHALSARDKARDDAIVYAEQENAVYLADMKKQGTEIKKKSSEKALQTIEKEAAEFESSIVKGAEEMKRGAIERAMQQADANTAIIDELHQYARTIGEAKVKAYADSIGNDNFMRMIEEAAIGKSGSIESFRQYAESMQKSLEK